MGWAIIDHEEAEEADYSFYVSHCQASAILNALANINAKLNRIEANIEELKKNKIGEIYKNG